MYKCIQNFLVVEQIEYAELESLTNVYRRRGLIHAFPAARGQLLPNEIINLDPPVVVEDHVVALDQPPIVDVAEVVVLDQPPIVDAAEVVVLDQPQIPDAAEVVEVRDVLVRPRTSRQRLQSVRAKISRILETHFKCPICMEPFRNSIMLVCQHSLCDDCWGGIRGAERSSRTWRCPICRHPATSLPSDFNPRAGRYNSCRPSPFQQACDDLQALIRQQRQ
ncbi:unnamed protein product [Orchesella dallaii]|uniref:RING-type domain-containing protein n=1 Tax=Orchesella dallaii TaxID=48710 RepID=A0ABP1RDX7_9HEXA